MIKFTKFGDWDIVMNMCNHMPDDIRASNKQVLLNMAVRAEAIAKKHMNAQDLKWKPISPAHLAAKVQAGDDPRILSRKRAYFNAIQHSVNSKGTVSVAGVSQHDVNADGDNIADYARINEFGSIARNIPSRPLWGPTLKEVYDYAKENQIFSVGAVKAMHKRAGK